MNAKQKTDILLANGYKFERKHENYLPMYEWRSPKGQLVACESRNVASTNLAYKHWYKNGTHDWREDMGHDDLFSNHKQSPAIEAPATDSAIEEIPCALADKNAELEALRKELAIANARIANDAAYMTKLEGDLEAAKAIIVQAGQDFAALKAENARMKDDVQGIFSKLYFEDGNDKAINLLREFLLSASIATPQAPKEAEALRQPFPKFSVNQKVWILSKRHAYAALGKIISIRQLSNGVNQYELNHVGGYWYNENELEAHEDKSLIPYESDLS